MTPRRPAGDWHVTEVTAGAASLWSDASDLPDFLAANLRPEDAPPPLRAALARTRSSREEAAHALLDGGSIAN